MLINLRNALMTGKRLPYDAEIEYLESDGSQFIKVPGKISSTSRITITFKYTGATFSQFAPFGGGDRNMIREASLISGESSTRSWIYRCNDKQNLNVVNLANSQVHTVTWYKDGAILDGVDYPSLTTTNDFTPTRDYFGLFANLRDGDNAPVFEMRGYIMSAQVYDNGTLVRDFIPVRKGTVGYMYDRVSGKLFGNDGTGDFVLGPDVVPVEYIESHGTEYINAGFATTGNGLRVRLACEKTTSATSEMAVVGRDAGSGFELYFSGGQCGLWNSTGKNVSSDVSIVQGTKYSIDASINSSGASLTVNGSEKTSSFAPSKPPAADVLMFRHSTRFYFVGRVYHCEMWNNDVLTRRYYPIRVGSGSTWEGAMMDVLTRRIYRNQGDGAFGYGNDLKYPIPAA